MHSINPDYCDDASINANVTRERGTGQGIESRDVSPSLLIDYGHNYHTASTTTAGPLNRGIF
jgi:hypothetical protein